MPEKKTRLGFTREEIKNIYVLIGAEIGRWQARAVIEDLKISEYQPNITAMLTCQERLLAVMNGKDSNGQ